MNKCGQRLMYRIVRDQLKLNCSINTYKLEDIEIFRIRNRDMPTIFCRSKLIV